MKKQMLLAALAAGALMAGSAQAATIYTQNFDAGLNPNESVGGNFGVAGGVMGHVPTYYGNLEYSHYQLRLDLTQATDALLMFDFKVNSETTWDGMNLVYSTNGAFTKDHVLNPNEPNVYGTLQGRAGEMLGPRGISGVNQGRISFDLSSLVGQVVDIRFQFASDQAVIGHGIDIDNLTVTGGLPSAVPEPATWAMMIMGFGMAGGAIRARRRSWNLTAA